MATQVIPVTDRGTWLELRRRDLTASDVAAVAGLDPRRSALSVYEEKIGMTPGGLPDNDIMRRGRWLEPAVLAAVREIRPDWQVRPAAVYLRDPETRLGATPDAFAMIPDVGLANLQCKVVSAPVFEEQWGDEGVPPVYAIQTAIETGLADAVIGYIAALVIGTYSAEIVIREVPRHLAAERRAGEIARDFWNGVAAGLPPAVDLDKDRELIAALPATPAKEIDLSDDGDFEFLLDAYSEVSDRLADLDKKATRLKTAIQLRLGDAEVGIVPGWTVTWRESATRPHFVPAARKRTLRVKRRAER